MEDIVQALFVFAVMNGDGTTAKRIMEEHQALFDEATQADMTAILKGMTAMDRIMIKLKDVMEQDTEHTAPASIEQQAKQATDSLLASLRLH